MSSSLLRLDTEPFFSRCKDALRQAFSERKVLACHLWRLSMIFLMLFLPAVTGWSSLQALAHTATQTQQTDEHAFQRGVHQQVAHHQLPGSSEYGGTTASSQLRPLTTEGLTNHEQAVGEQAYFTYQKWQINDHLKAEVNIASGNLLIHANDLHIQGTGIDLTIERFYNVQATNSQVSGLSQHWNLSVGTDVYLQFNNDGSITYYSPSGTPFIFMSNGHGGYVDPPGLNATLVNEGNNNDGQYHLTFHKSGEVYEFGSGGHLIDDEDKNGNDFVYNETNGQIQSIVDTQGRTTTFTYNSNGRLTTITDPAGRTVQYTYDSNGNLSSSTNALGQKTTYSYESGSDDLTSISDPAGHTYTFTYNDGVADDQVVSVTDPTRAVTSFKYTFNGSNANPPNETVVTDARGNPTTYDSDNQLRVTKVTDALNHSQSTSYTSNDDVSSLTDSLTNTTQFTFDVNNNITSSADATGAKDSFFYQDSSHPFYPTGVNDAQGNSLAYTYDSPGNLTDVKDVTGGRNFTKAHYDYNSNGTLKDMLDGNNNETTYSYDSNGNLITVTPPQPLGATHITRDNLSRAIKVVDGKGQATSYTYDALDRITRITYADGSVITYTRDAAGNVVSITDNTGITSFSYDAANRLLSKTLPGGVKLSMTYDSVGNLTSFTDPGGTVTYSYNPVNLVTTLTEPGNLQTTFGYDNNNRRTSTTYPNGVKLSLSYDKAGKETGISAQNNSGTTLASYSYDYEGTHLRQSMKDNVLNQETDYHYNSVNRLLEASVQNSSGTQIADFQYAYDNAGNRTSQTINGTTTTFSYNAANELTSASTGVNYTYDANGNLTGISTGNESFVYNAKDQTITMAGVSMTYTGADQNQRVKAGGTNYINSPLGISSLNSSSGQIFYTRDNQGNLVDERTPSGRYYYLFDGLGSIVGLTDSSGTLVNNERYQYDPYGNLLKAPVSAVLQANIWRFASGQFDAATGFTKFGVRYYDPTVGRWTQQDPVGGSLFDPRSPNRYVYAKCDPINIVDPGGKASCFEQVAIFIFSTLIVIGAFLSIPEAAFVSIPALISAITAGGSSLGAILGTIGSFGLALTAASDIGRCLAGG